MKKVIIDIDKFDTIVLAATQYARHLQDGIEDGLYKDGNPEEILSAIDSALILKDEIKNLTGACAEITNYLIDTHRDELDNNHYGDGQADCSYCKAIKHAQRSLKNIGKLL